MVLALGYFGLIPGLSSVLGADKPRDLGIRYTEADRTSARAKSQIVYATLPESTPPEQSRVFSGSRPVSATFSSAEITSLLNNRPWRYYPYKNMQIKFNGDGSAEVSGMLDKSKVPGYCAAIGIPKEAANFAMKFLPPNPVFYVKGRAALTNNKLSLFEPEAFELGRIPMPVSAFLALSGPKLVSSAFAASSDDMLTELSKVSNKKALIMNYINSRMASFEGFFAKSAYFAEDKLVFDGTLSKQEATVP